MDITKINTLGALSASGWQSKPVKQELRDNLITMLRDGRSKFDGVHGFERTVIPDLERAVLSRHNIILLGLRGQAKTRIARLMTRLLDEYVPVVKGSELQDDPFKPLSRYARDLIEEMGEDTPVSWMHRDQRYTEKLATPDVSVADLIGDVDPIKAATMKLPYSDERVLHFGLVPHSHRGIFVINELPDLQPRIQVALFNILQEGDIQIRGFKLRLPLDIQFIFTANPEDYTNRGSIITPLKDRIESQILTHYPRTIDISRIITEQEARILPEQEKAISSSDLVKDLIEQIAFEARESEFVDEKSGVSARMTITSYENLISAAERRLLMNAEEHTKVRIADFWGVIPAITGKVELVYEGEQEGPYTVALNLMGKAIRTTFTRFFPSPEQKKRKKTSKIEDLYLVIAHWFGEGNTVDIFNDISNREYKSVLQKVPGLEQIVKEVHTGLDEEERLLYMEFVLHGLAEFSLLNKQIVESGIGFSDLLSGMFQGKGDLDDEYED